MEALKQFLYPLELPSKTRTRPLQVIAVGPSRSGTRSLRAALLELEYDHCYHGFDPAMNPCDNVAWYQLHRKRANSNGNLTASDFDTVIGHCMAITDQPAAVFARELIRAYPDAKVILNIRRDLKAWHKSVMNTIVPMERSWVFWIRSWFCAELFWMQHSFFRLDWNKFFRGSFEQNSVEVLNDHCAMVKREVPSDRLLEWDVEDGWEPLCQFLGRPVPATPFPKGNNVAQYEAKSGDLYRASIAKADLSLAGVAAAWMAIRHLRV
ncbi:unnamed protein product [Penicillium pancosmium]